MFNYRYLFKSFYGTNHSFLKRRNICIKGLDRKIHLKCQLKFKYFCLFKSTMNIFILTFNNSSKKGCRFNTFGPIRILGLVNWSINNLTIILIIDSFIFGRLLLEEKKRNIFVLKMYLILHV